MQVIFPPAATRLAPRPDVGLSSNPDGPVGRRRRRGPLAQPGRLLRRELSPCAGDASPIARFAARPAKARTRVPIAPAFVLLCGARDRTCAGCGGVMMMPRWRPPPDCAPAVPRRLSRGHLRCAPASGCRPQRRRGEGYGRPRPARRPRCRATPTPSTAWRTVDRDECAERPQRRDPGRPRIPEEGERNIAQAQRVRT